MPLLFSGLSKSLKFGSSQLDFACLMTYNSRIKSKYMTALKKQDKEELKSNYINRELSWLKFNDRVLLEAQNIENPLYERVKFLSIAGSNLDEFFMVRVAGLYSQIKQLAFFLSPLADNLTTALVLCAVVLAVGSSSPKFVGIACVNIVVAANAGGAFSPFGDITTLMVWQAGQLDFLQFFALVIPSVVNYLIPAGIMHFFVSDHKPDVAEETVEIKYGGKVIILLGLLTILTAVSFHNFLHLPPVFGMMTGLAYLQLYSFYIKINTTKIEEKKYDFFENVAHVEWDTLLFFFGVILSVGGLGFIGYLEYVSQFMYTDLGATNANILVGILSAIVDNIPVMFAVLTMEPAMPDSQWLLVTLTAGVGGSMLSIGSAAGVALMGQSRGMYTFFGHLKWTPIIAIGYFASIYVHILINF